MNFSMNETQNSLNESVESPLIHEWIGRPAAARGSTATSAGCHVAPRHLARRYAARASGGRWRRSRHAGGPTQADLFACSGSD